MRTPRWLIESIHANNDREALQTITVYAVGEIKEQVKAENRNINHKRKLLLIDAQ